MRHGILRSRVALSATVAILLLVPGVLVLAAEPDARAAAQAQAEELIDATVAAKRLPGLAVAVVSDQEVVFFVCRGVANRETGALVTPDTLFQIGSITKTFTATLLVQLRDDGLLQLDDPVRKRLAWFRPEPGPPTGAPEITFRHLASHTAGLPRLPLNLTPAPGDPYNGYTADQMRAGLGGAFPMMPIGGQVEYSNWGVGFLGFALGKIAGEPYEKLVRERLFEPLGMTASRVGLAESKLAGTQGYVGADLMEPAPMWDLGTLAGAGAIVSSAADMARFVALQHRAGRENSAVVSGGSLAELHRVAHFTEPWKEGIGLGWFSRADDDLGTTVWHNGETSGFHGILAFAPGQRVGIVALTNGQANIDALGFELLRQMAPLVKPRPRSRLLRMLEDAEESPSEDAPTTGTATRGSPE